MCNKRMLRSAAMEVLILLAVLPAAAWCQAPVISSVVDAASYAPTLGASDALATIFGTNLASAAATAQAVPLPRELGGTTVRWNGIAVPLLYVSPTQINFQVPNPSDSTPVGVVVSTAAGSSASYNPLTATPSASGAGIFSTNGSGCGQGAVLNLADDGGASVNSATNSASPGQWISVWGTGAAVTAPTALPPDGAATPFTPLYNDIPAWPQFDFGAQSYTPSEFWSGFAPGQVGVNQYNVQIPASVREGCAVPVQLVYQDTPEAISQPVTLAIRKGGGTCADPPAAGYGEIIWQKTVNTAASQAVTESGTVTVSLQSSPGMQAPAAPVFTEGPLPAYQSISGPSCSIPGYRSLGAGTVTAQGPGLGQTQVPAAPFPQGQVGGLLAYQATLPNGTAIQPGTYTITASGGADIGAFQAATQLGADIQIQTSLAGAPVFLNCAPLAIQWTGGAPDSWVSVRLLQGKTLTGGYGKYEVANFSARVRTIDGTVTLYPPSGGGGPGQSCAVPGGLSGVVSIEVDPDPSEVGAFSAPGLTLGGQTTWKYIHTFEASTAGN
jgi:uncharacterized protein (TIGR03437 family)